MTEQLEPSEFPEPHVPGPDELPTGETDPHTGEPIYETPEPPLAQTASDYFKISSAVESDDRWNSRVKIALEINGIPLTYDGKAPRDMLIKITRAVVEHINCTLDGTVDTSGVTDEHIDTAIQALGDANA